MGVKGEKEPSGLYILRISGVFTNQDRKAMEAAGRAEIDRSSKIKILILADGFAGWGKEGDWGDIRFMLEYDPDMEKIAVVADEKWRDPSSCTWRRATGRRPSNSFHRARRARPELGWARIKGMCRTKTGD